MTLSLTEDNHFIYKYNEIPFTHRVSFLEKFSVEYGAPKRVVLDFKNECLLTAKKIASTTSEKIFILLSGGKDSEVVLQSFILAKINITAIIVRFEDDLNLHDICYAIIACEKWGVPYRFLDLNIKRFWENDLFDYAITSQCISPQMCMLMYAADQIDGYPVIASGDCYLEPHQENWALLEKEKIVSLYKHFQLKNKNACPAFFQYTPEIIFSFMNTSAIKLLIQQTTITNSIAAKYEVYESSGFSLLERKKYTGYEKLQDLDYKFRSTLRSCLPFHEAIFYTNVNSFILNY